MKENDEFRLEEPYKIEKKHEFLSKYVLHQTDLFFLNSFCTEEIIIKNIPMALQRTEQCVSSIVAWRSKGFDHLVSGQYAIFLYFLSNCIWKNYGDTAVATHLFLLNKALNGIDLFYEIEMPRYFAIAHTVGMVFAKGKYGDYCAFHQGCTVGRDGTRIPTLESGVIMFPQSMVIGHCLVRENTVLAPGTKLINMDTPGNCFVFSGKSGRPIFKKLARYYADEYFIRSDSV